MYCLRDCALHLLTIMVLGSITPQTILAAEGGVTSFTRKVIGATKYDPPSKGQRYEGGMFVGRGTFHQNIIIPNSVRSRSLQRRPAR